MDATDNNADNIPDLLEQFLSRNSLPENRRRLQRKWNEATDVIRNIDPIRAATMLAGLLTCPELAANAVRLEQMIQFVLYRAKGNKPLNARQLSRLFILFGELGPGAMEDPTEDIFLSLVHFEGHNYRIFEGLWEANAFELQRLLSVVSGMPEGQPYTRLREEITGLLTLSELAAERRGLARYCCGGEYPLSEITPAITKERAALGRAVTFTFDEISSAGIEFDRLADFTCTLRDLREKPQENGLSDLRLTPLIRHSQGLLLAVPANVSTAIRFRIIEFAEQYNRQTKTLATNLASEYSSLVTNTPILGKSYGAPLMWRSCEHVLVSEVVQQADTDRVIHFLFLMDGFDKFREHDFTSNSPSLEGGLEHCQVCLDRAVAHCSARPGFKEGMTVLVGCGWGRGLVFPALESGTDDWRIEAMSIEQLVTLSWSRGFRPLHLFRLLDHLRELENRNVQLVNVNGPLNLYGYSVDQGFHMAPHSAIGPDMVQGAGPLMLMIPTNALLDVRRQVAQRHDVHVATPPSGASALLRRYHLNSFFDSDAKQPLYGVLGDAAAGQLRSVYEGTWLTVWLTSHTEDTDDPDGLFRFFDTFTKWLGTIVPAIETSTGNRPVTAVDWHIDYEMTTDLSEYSEVDQQSAQELFVQIETIIDPVARRITSRVPRSVFIALHQPQNILEKAVLMSLVDGVARLLDLEIDAFGVVDLAIGTDDARHFHLLEASEFGDYVADAIPRHPIHLEPFDDTLSRLGIAFRIEGLLPGTEVVGTKPCTTTLNRVVDSLWTDVRAILNQLDRKATIEKLLLNTMATERSNRQWQRTIRAVIALHPDEGSTLRVATEQISRNNLANGMCRYAIEMAVCECPENGGDEPGELELSRLMALIQLMCQYGGWSDGIMHEVIPAKLEVSALGLLLITGNFYEGVLEPYGLGMESERLRGYSKEYERLFKPRISAAPMAETTGEEFADLWEEEFGFGIDDTRQFLDDLEDQAIQEHSPVVCWNRSRFVDLTSKHMSANSANRLIDELLISPRPAWDQPPIGYTDKDIVPWRFKRRLSLVYRPIVQLTEANDGLCICTPESVRRGIALRVSRAFHAEYDDQMFRTSHMRSWVGFRRDQLGHEFAEAMAMILDDAGWQHRLEVLPQEILGRKLDRDFGDVDILAWDPKSGRTLVIECKNLFVAKTPSEVAKQLAEFRGKQDDKGRPDRLLRHNERVELLRAHPLEVERFVGIQGTSIESVLVFRNRVPIEFLDDGAVENVVIRYPETLASI